MLIQYLNRSITPNYNALFAVALGINISFCAYADETEKTLESVTVEASRNSQFGIVDAASAGIIDNNSGATFNPATDQFSGPWGQAFAIKAGTTAPFFFVTNVNYGTIKRQKFVPGQFSKEVVTTIGKLPVGTNAFDPTGPQGMGYDSANDILFVSSTANNSIVAYPNATTVSAIENPVVALKGDPLKAPVGLAINPIKGSLLAVNQLDNNLVEIAMNTSPLVSGVPTFKPAVLSVRTLDNTPVDPVKGTGSALFGIATTQDAKGNLPVYFTNSNTSSLNVLK